MMRKIILSIASAFCCLSLMSFSDKTEKKEESFDAQLHFETRGIRLGEVARDSLSRSFSFIGVNTGNAPLVLTYVHPSCNCVRIQYPREPIAPGDTLCIKGILNPRSLSDGPFRRDIIVRSNATEPKIRLLITGTITPDSIPALSVE